MGGIDDLIKTMQDDEHKDAEWCTPYQYAKTHNLYPQQVYTAAKRHPTVLKTKRCDCGRIVIHQPSTNEYYKPKSKEENQDAEA